MTVDGLGPAVSPEIETKSGETISEEPKEAKEVQPSVLPEHDNSEAKPNSEAEPENELEETAKK